MSEDSNTQLTGEIQDEATGEEFGTRAGEAAIDLGRVRDLVLAAHSDVVPEMIQGGTFDELMASVEPAREAYQRIASQAAEQASQRQSTPRVAAQPGQRSTPFVDIESLSPLGKISEGLRRI